MDRIAFIIGETFIFWSPIILTLAALAAACLFLAFYLGRSGNGAGAFLAVPLAAVFSMVLGRLIHWYCRADSYASFEAAMTDYSSGSYALIGVFAGCLLAACILRAVRIVKDLPQLLDCMCLAGAAGIGVGRLHSLFNSTDRGDILEGITQLPLAWPVANSVTGEPEYRLATFMLQAMAAGGIFALLLVFWLAMKRRCRNGDTCLLFLLLYGAAQIVLDSTRYDSLFLRSNGFVSIVQILSAAALVLAAAVFSVRLVRARGWRGWYIALWIPMLALLGGAGYMEYYVQRHGDQALFAYSVMGSCLLALVAVAVSIYTLALRAENRTRQAATADL